MTLPGTSSIAPGWSLPRLSRSIQITLILWGTYVAAQMAYCLVHTTLVGDGSLDLAGLLIWAMSEWGIWLLVTPMAFHLLGRCAVRPRGRTWRCLLLATGALAVTLSLRLAVDHMTGARSIGLSFVTFLPRYLAALTVVGLAWTLFLRPQRVAEPLALTPPEEPFSNGVRPGAPATLLVSKGRDECLIRVEQIQYVTAAGNYVEICCNDQMYLLRATMKQVEDLLPRTSFVRTHRSHIVHLDAIERIRARPSGNGVVLLRNGRTLSLSRSYKTRLQEHHARAGRHNGRD